MNQKEQMIEKAEHLFYQIYRRHPVVFERGQGVYLYDSDGGKYLDFGAGIAVLGLGHSDPEFLEAVKSQADNLIHVSNLFYNQPAIEAAEKLLLASQMERVFFTNSGTEAIEGALKIAKRYAYNCGMAPDYEIIAMKQSFHGRSLGSLSATGNDHYQKPFQPLIPGVKFAEFNNLSSVRALMNEKTCAVLMETVQGEGGIYPASREFLEGIRRLCDDSGALLMLDEIQCGMGRTGTMFAWQAYGIKPDVMAVAKALGNGLPIGAFLAQGKAANAMLTGDHGATYGGNPLVCAGARAVLDLYEKRRILSHVNTIAPYLEQKLRELVTKYDIIREWRGMGLMQGLEFYVPVESILSNALLEQKLVLIGAGSHVIRFVPPLVIEKTDVDEMIIRLENAFTSADAVEKARSN